MKYCLERLVVECSVNHATEQTAAPVSQNGFTPALAPFLFRLCVVAKHTNNELSHHNFGMKYDIVEELGESPVAETVHEDVVRVARLVAVVLVQKVVRWVPLCAVLE